MEIKGPVFSVLFAAVLFCSAAFSGYAQQEDRDSLVVLISAKSAQAVVRD